MRILRVYHGGRERDHRARDRALFAAGVELTLAVPAVWIGPGAEAPVSNEPFEVVELPVKRCGDVNRYEFDVAALGGVIRNVRPAVLDVHEEPFSLVSRQCLRIAPPDVPIAMYTAQNIDKRYPPPFAQFERSAYRRIAALYPCSAQAASVARGKGFDGIIDVLPLGYDDSTFGPGQQSTADGDLLLGFFGRLVPEKGVIEALRILELLNALRPARLAIVGNGPDRERAVDYAAARRLADRVEFLSWRTGPELAEVYRRCHVVLVPSTPTWTWTEQFGRVIVEAQASGAVVAGYASGAISEVARRGALLVEPGNLRELVNRIAALLSSPDEFARRRETGIRLAREWSWERVAARQLRLYELVADGKEPRLRLSRSPSARRMAATVEFGSPAPTRAGDRPFALPLLRRGGVAALALGQVIDAGVEFAARMTT